jgi:hypothetical protein
MKKIALITMLIFSMLHIRAQNDITEPDTSAIYQVETSDGNQYIGTIVERDWDKVILKTEKLGELRLNMKDIIKITPVKYEKFIKGKYWFKNPQSTRYFWSPNGYGLEQGEVYYQNVWILYNQFAAGVTDHFSIGLGIVPLFLFAGAPTPIWITPKFSIPVVHDKINIGAGALVGTVVMNNPECYGIVYGLTTFGSRDQNLSIGVGYGFIGDRWAKVPLINIDGMIRTGHRGYIITENYFINVQDFYLAILSLGGRQIISKIGLDYGLFIPLQTGQEEFVAIPWLGITVPISKTRVGKSK